MPPWALTYWKYAAAAGAISLYPGAAGPVSGWWLPMVIVVAVMPGADAVSAEFVLVPEPAPELALGLELELELHAATARAAAATTAMAGTRSRCDLFIECLLSRGVPGVRSPGTAEPRAGWSAPHRPEARHLAWMPCVR